MSNTSLLGAYGSLGNSSLLFRNKVINGAMTIDQRNAGAAVTLNVGSTYVVDRFYSQASQASKVSVQRSSLAPAGFANSLQSTVLAAVTPGAADYFTTARQNIEGFNVADLGWGTADAQPISISFWVRSSVTGTYSYFVLNNSGTRGYIANFVVSASNTWEYKTLVIPGDTSGTWEKTNLTGIGTGIDLGSGSNYQGTAGAWTSTDKLRTAGSVNWISNAGATFQITGVQLEAGPVATPFEHRPVGLELQMCMRYYQHIQIGGLRGSTADVSFTSTEGEGIHGNTIVPFRVAPTFVSFYVTKAGHVSTSTSSSTFATVNSWGISWNTSSSDYRNNAYSVGAGSYINLQAEL